MTPRRRREDVEAALWSGWLLTGWPMGSAAVVVWLLRTLPAGEPLRVGLVVVLAAVGISLAVLALPLAARLPLVGLLWVVGKLIARLRQGIRVVDSQPTTIPTPTAAATAGHTPQPQQTLSRHTPAPDDGMSRTR